MRWGQPSLCVAQTGTGQAGADGGGAGASAQNGFSAPAGRNIGLCNGQLKAMSGDEVENKEQEELADCVGRVGSSRGGGLAGGRRESFSAKFTDSALLCPRTQVSVFFRTSPKHKLKIIKVSWEPVGRQGRSGTVVGALLRAVQGPSWQEPWLSPNRGRSTGGP